MQISLALHVITDILQSVVDKLKDGTLRYLTPPILALYPHVLLSSRPFVFKTVGLQQVIEELTRLSTYPIGKLVMTIDTSDS